VRVLRPFISLSSRPHLVLEHLDGLGTCSTIGRHTPAQWAPAGQQQGSPTADALYCPTTREPLHGMTEVSSCRTGLLGLELQPAGAFSSPLSPPLNQLGKMGRSGSATRNMTSVKQRGGG